MDEFKIPKIRSDELMTVVGNALNEIDSINEHNWDPKVFIEDNDMPTLGLARRILEEVFRDLEVERIKGEAGLHRVQTELDNYPYIVVIERMSRSGQYPCVEALHNLF